jgi:protein-disulfide isomerase
MDFYFWILHPVACVIRNVGNTVPTTICIAVCFIIPYCRYMFRSLFDHLQAEYSVLVFEIIHLDLTQHPSHKSTKLTRAECCHNKQTIDLATYNTR